VVTWFHPLTGSEGGESHVTGQPFASEGGESHVTGPPQSSVGAVLVGASVSGSQC
jgi:hypothetical protein